MKLDYLLTICSIFFTTWGMSASYANASEARALLPAPGSSQVAPPNVIIVITDDQGYGDLGCHGNSIVETQRIKDPVKWRNCSVMTDRWRYAFMVLNAKESKMSKKLLYNPDNPNVIRKMEEK